MVYNVSLSTQEYPDSNPVIDNFYLMISLPFLKKNQKGPGMTNFNKKEN